MQEEPLSSTAVTGMGSNSSSANGSLGPMSNYDPERDKADLMPNTLWTGKLTHHKSGSVTTPDGNWRGVRCGSAGGSRTSWRSEFRERNWDLIIFRDPSWEFMLV